MGVSLRRGSWACEDREGQEREGCAGGSAGRDRHMHFGLLGAAPPNHWRDRVLTGHESQSKGENHIFQGLPPVGCGVSAVGRIVQWTAFLLEGPKPERQTPGRQC